MAQNWLDLDAEHAPSSFDQRHLLTAQVEYAGTSFLRNWVFTSQLTVGTGLPLTPLYLTSLAGTGLTGALRGSYTGAPLSDAPAGFYVNPAAFSAPASGEWGNAGRNSITGPAQFSLNAGITRTFLLSNRWSMDWRIDGTNILNRVTYSGLNTIVGSPQFGLPEPREHDAEAALQPASEVLNDACCDCDPHRVGGVPASAGPFWHNSPSFVPRHGSSSRR